MMTEWEQVEHLRSKGYQHQVGPDGWVTVQGPYASSQFSPERWAKIEKMLSTPPRNRPQPMTPYVSPEDARAARDAALDVRPAARAPSSRPEPRTASAPAQARPPARQDMTPLPLF